MTNDKYIELYKVRGFGNIISDGFNFFFRNLKNLSSLFLTWVLPFLTLAVISFLIPGNKLWDIFLNMDQYMANADTDLYIDLILGIGTIGLANFLAVVALMSATAAYMHEYEETSGEVVMKRVHQRTRESFWRVFGLYLLVAAVFLVLYVSILYLVIAISAFIGFLFLILLPLFVYLFVLLTIAPATLVCEPQLAVIRVFHRIHNLMRSRWWFTLGITIVVGMICGMTRYIFGLPFFIISMAQGIIGIEGTSDMSLGFWGGLSFFVYLIGALYVYILQCVSSHLCYFSFVEEKEGRGFEEKLQKTEIVENPNFGNEGDF